MTFEPIISTHTASPDQLAAQFACDDAEAAYKAALMSGNTQEQSRTARAYIWAKAELLTKGPRVHD